MAVSDVRNEVLEPTGSQTVETLQFTVKFNCDIATGIRSKYWEASHDFRISVNAVSVYSQEGSGILWDGGTGSGTVERRETGTAPITPEGSAPLWYTLSSADVSNTSIQSGVAFDLSIDMKHYSSEVWTEVISNSVTLTTEEEETEVEVSATIAGTGTITLNREGLPGAPTDPSPVDAATNVNLSTGFAWTNGANTDTTALYMDFGDGYFEIASGLESAAYALAQDLFDYGWIVKWRIYASNDYGTTVGPEWTFTALDIDPPYPSWEPIEGGSGEGPGTGVEGTDFLYSGRNNVITSANLVAIANNRLWYSSWSEL